MKRPSSAANASGNIQIQRRKGGRATEGEWNASTFVKLVWVSSFLIVLVMCSFLSIWSEEVLNSNHPTQASSSLAALATQTKEQESQQRRIGERWERMEKARRAEAEKRKKDIKNNNGNNENNKKSEGGSYHLGYNPSPASPSEQLILQWLQKERNIQSNPWVQTEENDSLSHLLTTPQYFPPGSLPLSQLATLQQCYVDPNIYRRHFNEGLNRRIPYSAKHELAYLLLPKSGSSTGRFMMKHEFDATEQFVRVEPKLKNVIAFVREPLSRFYSSYDEAFVRTAPWQTNKVHPFPYLHEGMHSYHDYEDHFCPPSTRSHRRDCIYRASAENGTLAHRLERFVLDYNGREPFDIHLALQAPLLSNVNTGRSIFITELHNTTNAEGDWNAIAKRYLGEQTVLQNAKKNMKGSDKESGGVIQGRSYPRRFDKSLVSEESEWRICELALLDYCCLNFPLPEVCRGGGGNGVEDGSGGSKELSCKMDYDAENGGVRIQPGIFPERRKT